MYNSLSEIQRQKFFEISGKEYKEGKLRDKLYTHNAYNDNIWEQYSPWVFSYVIEPDTGYFICELAHRMTNNRIYGWDREGNELGTEITEKYFEEHL